MTIIGARRAYSARTGMAEYEIIEIKPMDLAGMIAASIDEKARS